MVQNVLLKAIPCLLLALIALPSCVREPVRSPVVPRASMFGPQTKDTELNLGEKEKSEKIPVETAVVSIEENYQIARLLLSLGQLRQDPDVVRAGQDKILGMVDNGAIMPEVSARAVPYAELIADRTRENIETELANLKPYLENQQKLVFQLIDDTAMQSPYPDETAGLAGALRAGRVFLRIFLEKLKYSNVDPAISSAITMSIEQEVFPALRSAIQGARRLEGQTDLFAATQVLKDLLQHVNVEMDSETQAALAKAEGVGAQLNSENDEKSVFAMLIDLWQSMEPEARAQTFKAKVPSLFEFLDGKSAGELECLKQPECGGLWPKSIRKWVIYPAIAEYGVSKLEKELNDSTVSFLKSGIGKYGRDFLNELPNTLKGRIAESFQSKSDQYRKIRADYNGYVADRVMNWHWLHLGDTMSRGSEAATGGAGAVGAGLAATLPLVESFGGEVRDPQKLKQMERLIFQRINQLVVLSGELKRTYAAFPRVNAGLKATLKLADQSEIFLGLSSMMMTLRDWREQANFFDRTLGDIKAFQILSDFPEEKANVSFFPKDAIYSLALKASSEFLDTLTKHYTPAFVLCPDQTIAWTNTSDPCGNKSILVGAVDVAGGGRVRVAETAAVARFLKSIVYFLRATEGIEESASPYLTRPYGGQPSAVSRIVAARPKLRIMAVGLANFLSHVMTTPEGRVFTHYERLKGDKTLKSSAALKAQIMTMDALLEVSDYLNVNIYRWSAIDAYHYMNREMWNGQTRFYGEKPRLTMVLRMSDVLSRLKKHLSKESQDQADRLLDLWFTAVKSELAKNQKPAPTKN